MRCVSHVSYNPPAMVKVDLLTRAMEAISPEGPVAPKAVEILFERLAAALERVDRVVLRQGIDERIANVRRAITETGDRGPCAVVVAEPKEPRVDFGVGISPAQDRAY